MKPKKRCKVEHCTDRRSLASVLCDYHAREYYRWRSRVDLSTVRGESSCDWWLHFGNVPTPKQPLRKGEVISFVIGLVLDDDELEPEDPPCLGGCDPAQLRVLSVRVPAKKLFAEFSGEIVFGEEDDGAPCRCQAVDGWYASWEDARRAIEEAP